MTSAVTQFQGHRVYVDGRVLTHPTAAGRGVARYTIGIVRAAAAAGIETIILCASADDHATWADATPDLERRPFLPRSIADSGRADSAETRSWFVCTQLMLHPVCLDVVPRFVTAAGIGVVGVLHDVIPQRFPERYLTDPAARVQTVLRESLCRTLDVFWTNSTFTADTGAIELGVPRHRLHPIGAVTDEMFCPGGVTSCPAGIQPGSVVAVTGADDRKNTERLIRAWSHVSQTVRGDRQLVIACAVDRDTHDRWHHIAHHCGVADSVVITGAVSDAELVSLYRSAVLGVMPSLEEGFGLPVAESIACGVPCLASNVSSLPEVSGSAEGLFDPYDVMSMATTIETFLADPSLRSQLLDEQTTAAQRWTTDAVGQRMCAALDATRSPAQPAPQMRSTPPSLTVVCPPTGADTGIAEYTDLVLRNWPGRTPLRLDDIDLGGVTIHPRDDEDGRSINSASGGRLHAGHLGRHLRLHDSDHMVVVLGSSPHHAIGADRARAGRCHIWLHEPTLVGAVVGPFHMGGGATWMARHLADWDDGSAAMNGVGAAGLAGDAAAFHTAGIDFCQPVVAGARSIIVSSDAAAEVVRRYGDAPVLVLPLAYPHRPLSVPRFGKVVSLGRIDDGKQPDELIGLAAGDQRIEVVLIGRISDDVRARCRGLADSLGCADRVRITGALSDDELHEELADAWAGVQLRRGHVGQMSASVTELVARGIPVVTSLSTHAPGGPGLQIIDGTAAPEVLDALDPWWSRAEWDAASHWCRSTASAYPPSTVAERLVAWLDEADSVAPGVYR